jgi:hemerythrin superfamily protein
MNRAVSFVGGMALGAVAMPLLAPHLGYSIGQLRTWSGADPFQQLETDHRTVIAALRKMEDTEGTLRRTVMLKMVKRALTAHALAEENVVYGLLHDEAGRGDEAMKLFQEHAEIKMLLRRLEEAAANDGWTGSVRALRQLIETHAAEEEAEVFPRLRTILGERLPAIGSLLGRERFIAL